MHQNHTSFDLDALKTKTINGAIFLIPLFLAGWVLVKVFGLMRELASGVSSAVGIELPMGGVLLNIVALVLAALACLFAGSVAERAGARRLRNRLDNFLLGAFPGYAFVKGLAENIQQNEAAASSFIPVLLTTGDGTQIAFETDRLEAGAVAVYVPGAPNPWSGTVMFVNPDQVKKLAVSAPEALKILRTLGRGSEALAMAHRALAAASAAGEAQ